MDSKFSHKIQHLKSRYYKASRKNVPHIAMTRQYCSYLVNFSTVFSRYIRPVQSVDANIAST